MTSDCCGWGGGIYGYFKPNATVINYATAWASSKVFVRSAEWDKMLVVKPVCPDPIWLYGPGL